MKPKAIVWTVLLAFVVGILAYLLVRDGDDPNGAAGDPDEPILAVAGDWPQWRGPNHNGSNEAMNLPSTWSVSEGVLWSTPMPGISSATPVVSGDHVFVVSNNEARTKAYGLCLDRGTGKVLWSKELVSESWSNARNTAVSSSPVTDGKRVYFLFGTSDMFAFDFDGKKVWSKNLDSEFGPINPDWGYGSSPMLYDGRLYVTALRRRENDSIAPYVLCLDPATGKKIWNVARASDAVGEAQDAYTSPIPYENDGKPALVVAGSDYITCHDAATGEELWRHAHNPKQRENWRLIPSPAIVDGLVIGVVPRGGAVFAIRPGDKTDMAYEDADWIYDAKTTDVPTPLVYKGRLYVMNGDRRIMMCLDPKTGKEIWKGDLDGDRFWASPTAGDDKIYCVSESGEVVVLAAGDEFEIVSRTETDGSYTQSSVAIAGSNLFIRTGDALYCVGSAES